MEILKYPNPFLKKISEAIDVSSAEERDIVLKNLDIIAKLMYDSNGLGLAAPQVGIGKRFFILDVDQVTKTDEEGNIVAREPGKLQVFINPVITPGKETTVYEEGCLSVPGIYENVKRAKEIRVEYFDINFTKQTIDAEGILAIVIQHETDHLDGKLFVDRLPTVKKALVKKRLEKNPPL